VIKAGITVVHWGSVDDTLECLASLAAIEHTDLEVALVINGVEAADPRLEASALGDGVHVLQLPENVGYAAAANAGARDLFARGAEAVLMLNNDTTVTPRILSPLVDVIARDPRTGIAGPVIVYADDPQRVWFGGGTLHPLLGLTRHHALDAPVESCVRALGAGRTFAFVNGCALMIRREAFERTGGLEPRYFHYFDDLDICERARAAGFDSVVVGDASVAHKVSSATGHRGTNRLTAAQAYFFTRNRFLFLRWNMRGARRIVALAAQIAVLLPYEVARHLLDRDPGAAIARVRGLVDGILGRSGRRARWARHD
jgi:GT2 family glycosyltransferase